MIISQWSRRLSFSSMMMTSNDNKEDYINDDNDGNDIARSKKIAIQGKCPDVQWSRNPLAYRESNLFLINV